MPQNNPPGRIRSNNTLSIYQSILENERSLGSSNSDLWRKPINFRHTDKHFHNGSSTLLNHEKPQNQNFQKNQSGGLDTVKIPIDQGLIRSDGFYKGRNEAIITKSKDRLKREKDSIIND